MGIFLFFIDWNFRFLIHVSVVTVSFVRSLQLRSGMNCFFARGTGDIFVHFHV